MVIAALALALWFRKVINERRKRDWLCVVVEVMAAVDIRGIVKGIRLGVVRRERAVGFPLLPRRYEA